MNYKVSFGEGETTLKPHQGLHPGLWPCSERAGFVHWYLGVGVVSVSNGWVGWPFDGGLASMETLRSW